MRFHLRRVFDVVASSYWSIPAAMTVAAVGAAVGMTWLDGVVGDAFYRALDLRPPPPTEARTLLQVIASGALSVAGVLFSVAVAAVSYASGQYGPRLIASFMRDTGNRVALGMFVATFAYGLTVIRAIHAPEEGPTFVPHLAVFGAFGFAAASVGALIYFLHHLLESIHVSNVVASVGRDLRAALPTRYPLDFGAGPAPRDEEADGHASAWTPPDAAPGRFEASWTGYVASIDGERLLDAAREHDAVVRLCYAPGDFVAKGRVLAEVWPAAALDHDDVRTALRRSFAVEGRRTPFQDPIFTAGVLAEIAIRALSPAINEPLTARRCLDWLGAALECLATLPPPSALRHDEAGALRVVASTSTFGDVAEAAFGLTRPYVAADRNAALHLFKVLAQLARVVERAEERAVLRDHAEAAWRDCEADLGGHVALDEVRERYAVAVRLLRGGDYDEAYETYGWLAH